MLNQKQAEAVTLVSAGHNVFISGPIGTGKTVTLISCLDALKSKGKHVAATAATGLASQHIKGEMLTIYYFAFGLHIYESKSNL